MVWAILATLLFSLSTPFTKIFADEYPPLFLSALLYGGSVFGASVGIIPFLGLAPRTPREFLGGGGISRTARWALAGSILIGGVVAPVLLMVGLSGARASQGSLLMNAEGIFTVLIAGLLFRERLTGRLIAGTILGGAGCALLSWKGTGTAGLWALPFLGAALLWALDSNILRYLSSINPLVLTVWKGMGSSLLLLLLSVSLETLPRFSPEILAVLLTGAVGYGMSLVFFIRSIGLIGVSRTGAWFSFSPFLGALLSLLVLREPVPGIFPVSFGILMVAAVLLQENAPAPPSGKNTSR
ncbi:MAG: DMT family transporter [Nitrospirae bacterium]|nr:DMT family transporter [Nitrospirota bacterium]